jgi:hypothetical protein
VRERERVRRGLTKYMIFWNKIKAFSTIHTRSTRETNDPHAINPRGAILRSSFVQAAHRPSSDDKSIPGRYLEAYDRRRIPTTGLYDSHHSRRRSDAARLTTPWHSSFESTHHAFGLFLRRRCSCGARVLFDLIIASSVND